MADESYSLSEVADSLGVRKDEVVRRVHQGEFPGRFLTSDFEMRIPARDVRKALERMSPRIGARSDRGQAQHEAASLVAGGPGSLEVWSREREVLEGLIVEREERLSDALREGFEGVHRRLDELARRLDAVEWNGQVEIAESAADLDALLREVRALERLAGLDGLLD